MARAALSTLLLISPALSAPAMAQGSSVLRVDPSDPSAYNGIQAAINAAAPHDIVVVAQKPFLPVVWPLLYPPITIDKSLTITAEAGADVRCWSAEIVGLASDDQVVLRGITFERPTFLVGFGAPTLRLADSDGFVLLEDCAFRAATPFGLGVGITHPAIEVTGSTSPPIGSLTLVRCEVAGISGGGALAIGGQMQPAVGIRAVRMHMAIYETHVRGGNGAPALASLGLVGTTGANAVEFDEGLLFASASSFTGGDAGAGTPGGCVVRGNGGTGLVLDLPTTTAELLDTVRVGGSGGPGCPPGGSGAAESVGSATLRVLTPPSSPARPTGPGTPRRSRSPASPAVATSGSSTTR